MSVERRRRAPLSDRDDARSPTPSSGVAPPTSLQVQHVVSSPQQASASTVGAVQRQAGNQALLTVLRAGGGTTTTPRKPKKGKMVDPLELTGGLSEQKGGIFATTGSALDSQTWKTGGNVEAWNAPKDPNAPSTPDPKASDPNQALGFTGGSFALLQSGVGVGFASKTMDENRREYLEAKRNAPESKARMEVAVRNMKMSGADIGKNVVGTGAAVTDLTAKGLGITQAGSQAAATAGAAGGFFALPLALFNAVRDSRKAYKAWERCQALEKVFNDWDNPRFELEQAKEQFEQAEVARSSAETGWQTATKDKQDIEASILATRGEIQLVESELRTLRTPAAAAKGFGAKLKAAGTWVADKAKIAKLEIQLALKKRELESRQVALLDAVEAIRSSKLAAEAAVTAKGKAFERYEQGKQAFENMTRIVGSTGEKAQAEQLAKAKGQGSAISRTAKPTDRPSLLEIQAYALNKNKGGLIKKVISSVGGFLAVGGAAASLAVALAAAGIAGTVALAATPVGWALAGAAAAAGLALAGYKAVKWLKKRWQQSEFDDNNQKRSGISRLGATLAVWKATGKSRREHYGTSLLDMALGDKVFRQQQERAVKLVEALTGRTFATLGLQALYEDADVMVMRPVTQTDKSSVAQGAAGASGTASGPKQLVEVDLDDTKGQEQTPKENQKLKAMVTGSLAHKNYKAAKDLITTKMGS